ncbi:hypothetical protein JXI42_01250 [bacterium]|nr:hypothetical protein [bacterium]
MNNPGRISLPIVFVLLIWFLPLFGQEEEAGVDEQSKKKTDESVKKEEVGTGVTMTILLRKVKKEIDVSKLHYSLTIKPVSPPLLDESSKPVKLELKDNKIEIKPRLKLDFRSKQKEND